ncbi:MAG: hypothetical protein A2231_06655 [Candidatus Firestonebacteria bacterium RIFOXYA2_FULL_40_8]|nr:MAG: hypothetical protein A2231_06655 [Candidatus Firestonebacteria bacterium RIFOXYA2_FULL_40_8]
MSKLYIFLLTDLFAVSLAVFANAAEEKKEYAVIFSSGELPSAKLLESADLSVSDKYVCKYELTTENAEVGKNVLKATLTRKKDKFGVLNPKNPDWNKWDGFKCKVYNPQDFSIKLSFVVRDRDLGYGKPGGNDWDARCDITKVISPGWNELEIDFTILSINDAKDYINVKKILEWSFSGYSLDNELAILYYTDIEYFNE